jgi:hypothetical protein
MAVHWGNRMVDGLDSAKDVHSCWALAMVGGWGSGKALGKALNSENAKAADWETLNPDP